MALEVELQLGCSEAPISLVGQLAAGSVIVGVDQSEGYTCKIISNESPYDLLFSIPVDGPEVIAFTNLVFDIFALASSESLTSFACFQLT